MGRIPERRLEPPAEWEKEPQCPICGYVCETIYIDHLGMIVGCDECMSTRPAAEMEECYEPEY